jgi:hypothetical protein
MILLGGLVTLPDTPLTEAQARDLLARAAEIDTTISPQTQLAELRKAALEAGIHPRAFDRAAREMLTALQGAKPSLWSQVRQNLIGAGLFWVTLTAIVQPLIWDHISEPGRTLGLLIACFGGIQMADRLGARLVRNALIAVTAGQLVLFGFSFAELPSIGANVLTWVAFLTGVLATTATAAYSWKDRRLSPPAPDSTTLEQSIITSSPDDAPLPLDGHRST